MRVLLRPPYKLLRLAAIALGALIIIGTDDPHTPLAFGFMVLVWADLTVNGYLDLTVPYR